MMMIIITRYPASEDRLIVRPLLSRVCALRLQPAEPQPYSSRWRVHIGEQCTARLVHGRRRGCAGALQLQPGLVLLLANAFLSAKLCLGFSILLPPVEC